MRFLTNYAKSCDLRSIMRNRNIAEYQKPWQGLLSRVFLISQRSEACNPSQFQNEAKLLKTVLLKQTAEQRCGVKNRYELNWNLTGMVSSVHVAQSLSQSVKAVLVFLIYKCITVKLRKPITIITVKFRIRKQTSKPHCYYRCSLRFNYLAPYSGAPNVNFRKISVRKTIWDLEFS